MGSILNEWCPPAVAVLSVAHKYDTCSDFHSDLDTGGAHRVLQDNAWIAETMQKFRNNSEHTKQTLRAKVEKWRLNVADGNDSVEGYGGSTSSTTGLQRHYAKFV